MQLQSDFPGYQRQTLGWWESSDHWLRVVPGWVRIDRSATPCQQVFRLVLVAAVSQRLPPPLLALGLVLARKEFQQARELEFQQAREFQQQVAEFLGELVWELVWELVRDSIARLVLLGPKCDRPSLPVRVPKTADSGKP